MFTLFPFLIQHYLLKSKFSIGIKKTERKNIFLWSVFVFVIVFAASFALKSFLDLEAISSDFSNRLMLSNRDMILAGIYTIFINSLIEEYFFRGFIFQGLLKQEWHKPAYIISSTAFAVYHEFDLLLNEGERFSRHRLQCSLFYILCCFYSGTPAKHYGLKH